MSGLGLTERQERALRAVADPSSPAARSFWHDARASWAGPRRTLGSLLARGLVDYNYGPQGGPQAGARWTITESGDEILRLLDRSSS